MFMILGRIISAISLSVLIFFWFYTIPNPKKDYLKNMTSSRMLFVYLMAFFLYFQISGFFQISIPVKDNYFLLFSLGLVLLLFGFIFGIWAKITMKNNWNTPGTLNAKIQKKLIISGPFAYSRNPIYFGLSVYFLGIQLLLKSYFVFLMIPIIIFIHHSILQEEKLLEKTFREKYLKYKSRVPRYFLKRA